MSRRGSRPRIAPLTRSTTTERGSSTAILSRSPGVILLDEPDAHLHSSLQRTVIDVLDDLSRTRQMQVVLSTHSKEIINYVDPSRLVLIEKGSVRALGLGEAATQLTILQSLGAIDSVDAYALVRNKRCLFLEGPTDVAIVERFAARLGLAVFAGDDRVVIVPTRGADRLNTSSNSRYSRLFSVPRWSPTKSVTEMPEPMRCAQLWPSPQPARSMCSSWIAWRAI
ncbi:MAG: ATP-dependent endonuclease [Candidatus Limnocylindrales bacterium]